MDKQVFMSRSIFVLVSVVGVLLTSSGSTHSKLGRHRNNSEQQLPTNTEQLKKPRKFYNESSPDDRPFDLNNLKGIITIFEVAMNRCTAVGLNCTPNEYCADSGYGLYCKCRPCSLSSRDSLVCGSNGYTYDAMCHLRHISCLNNINISLAHEGRCRRGTGVEPQTIYQPPASKEELNFDADGTEIYEGYLRPNNDCVSKDLYCNKYGYCFQKATYIETECGCVQCKRTGTEKICASDGYIYPSVCEIKRMACLSKTSIYYSKQHHGPCKEGAVTKFIRCQELDRRCSIHAECRWDLELKSHRCHCIQKCNKSPEPVCGTNAKSFTNLCELELFACTNNANITKAYDGFCTKYLPIKGI